METPDFKEIAAQLRQPQGTNGLETARRMEENNANMIRTTIDRLGISAGCQVLETGFGGGAHVDYLLQKAPDVHYCGTDISADMTTLAGKTNEQAVARGVAEFHTSAPDKGIVPLPFPAGTFDRMFTVNTLYFWDDAPGQARELLRVLKPGGLFLCCFATEDFMKSLPFTAYGFHLYSTEKAVQLMEDAGFTVRDITEETEVVMSNAGQQLERTFIVLHLTK